MSAHPEAIIEITVKPRIFRMRVSVKDWDSWSENERSAWCKNAAKEKVHFDHVFCGLRESEAVQT